MYQPYISPAVISNGVRRPDPKFDDPRQVSLLPVRRYGARVEWSAYIRSDFMASWLAGLAGQDGSVPIGAALRVLVELVNKAGSGGPLPVGSCTISTVTMPSGYANLPGEALLLRAVWPAKAVPA